MNIRNNYLIKSNHALPEIKKRLKLNTLEKNKLTREKTDKAFIGQITQTGFVIITSTALGVVCAVTGRFNPNPGNTKAKGTEIAIETRTQSVFFIMIAVWFALMMIMAVIVPLVKDAERQFSAIPLLVIVSGVVVLRILLHYL